MDFLYIFYYSKNEVSHMVLRHQYLDKLNQLKDKNIIKVITGVRCCGKSTLLKQFADQLKQQEVPESAIIFLQLDRAVRALY